MNAHALRHFYNYHFAENRKIWDSYVMPLTNDQFTQNVDYSHGSVREQIIHLMSVDEAWFSDLGAVEIIDSFDPSQVEDRQSLRAHWDEVERQMRQYLAGLEDDTLTDKPLEGEDKNLILWQVLLHVVNHGTDHRAQLLRLLNDMGIETNDQDYIFYVYGNP
jgi:uncharacterized damage-inducible protein DinB